MRKIKIAQIGIGHDHALELLNCIVKHTDIFEFVGLAIPESEKTDFAKRYEKVASYNTLTVEQALNYGGLEAIAIETEDDSFYCYPKHPEAITKLGFATEEIYQFRLADPNIFLEKYAAYLPADARSGMQG